MKEQCFMSKAGWDQIISENHVIIASTLQICTMLYWSFTWNPNLICNKLCSFSATKCGKFKARWIYEELHVWCQVTRVKSLWQDRSLPLILRSDLNYYILLLLSLNNKIKNIHMDIITFYILHLSGSNTAWWKHRKESYWYNIITNN